MNTVAPDRMNPNPETELIEISELLDVSEIYLVDVAGRAPDLYNPFDLQQESRWRHIDNPAADLKRIQRLIHDIVLCSIELPPTFIGGVPDRSILDNARIHVGKPTVVRIDIRDCFPNTRVEMIREAFASTFSFSKPSVDLLTTLCSYQGRLPQGSPASPMLSNIVLLDLHEDVRDVCAELGLDFSFYIDDITISGSRAVDAIEPIIARIRRAGHSVRNKKILRMPRNVSQVVTGLCVNGNLVTVTRSRYESIRREIITLSKESAISNRDLCCVRGRIAFVKAFDPKKGEKLEDLDERLLPEEGDEAQSARVHLTRSCPSYWSRRCLGRKRRA